MAIKRPDIYEHNNPNDAIVDSDFLRGGFRTTVANQAGLFALSTKSDQLKQHATIVYVSGETKYYILKDITNIGNANGWQVFNSGSGGSGTLTGATNGLQLMNTGTTVALGGTVTEGTTISLSGGSAGLTFTDLRSGANQKGILYGGNYSVNYDPRSLVDKGYVDTVATGLNVHAAAVVTTTGTNIALSGTPIIDGIQTVAGWRVLVRNQTNGALNGVYVVTGGTWQRADDYNFTPFGEISNGDLIPVITGSTLNNTLWVLVTQNPIFSGLSLNFSLFQQTIDVLAGAGIDVSMVGGIHTVSVMLPLSASTACGLSVSSYGLCVDSNIAKNGLSYSNGEIKLGGILYTGDTIITTPNNSGFEIGGGNPANSFGGRIDLCRCDSITNLNSILLDARQGAGSRSNIFLIPSGITIGSDASGFKGAVYSNNYCANFVDRSLIDKEYVDNQITGGTGVYDACNGLTKVAGVVALGGNLTGNTFIALQSNAITMVNGTPSTMFEVNAGNDCLLLNTELGVGMCVDGISNQVSIHSAYSNYGNNTVLLNTRLCGSILKLVGSSATLSGTSVNLKGTTYLVTAPNTGSNSDDILVRDSGTGEIKTINGGSVLTSAITGATNGLHKVGQVVALGGSLTGATDIYGAHDLSFGLTTPLYTFATIATSDIELMIGAGSSDLQMFADNANLRAKCVLVGVTGGSGSYMSFTGTTIDAQGTVKLLSTPNTGASTDSLLVWNSADKTIKKISGGSVLTSAITGATNGLNKVGQVVALGGNLTGNTMINLSGSTLRLQSDNTSIYGLAEFGLNSTYSNSKFGICSRDVVNGSWGLSGNSSSISTYHCSTGNDGSCFNINNTGLTISNKVSSASKSVVFDSRSLSYCANYCSSNTSNPRWIPDKEYVDKQISGNSNIYRIKWLGAGCFSSHIYTASNSDDVLAVSGITYNPPNSDIIKLPNFPVLGERITVVDACLVGLGALSNPITIDGNGKYINNGSCSTINTDFGSITFVYNGIFWSAIAFVN